MCLFATLSFSQYNNPIGLSGEVFGGFQWNRTKEGDLWTTGPGLFLSGRLFGGQQKSVNMGFSLSVVFTFITEMEYMVPKSYTSGSGGLEAGEIIVINREYTDKLNSFTIFAGPCSRASLFPGVSVVFDFGLVFGIDTAKYESVLVAYGANRANQYLDLQTTRMGLGAGVGLQISLGFIAFEAGANLGYYFWKWNSIDSYVANPTDIKNTKYTLESKSGNFESVNFFRFGAPYIAVGLKM